MRKSYLYILAVAVLSLNACGSKDIATQVCECAEKGMKDKGNPQEVWAACSQPVIQLTADAMSSNDPELINQVEKVEKCKSELASKYMK